MYLSDALTDSLQPTASTAIRSDYLMIISIVKGSRRGQASLRLRPEVRDTVMRTLASQSRSLSSHAAAVTYRTLNLNASSENLQPHAGAQAHIGIKSTSVSQSSHNQEYYSQGHQYWVHPQATKDGDSHRLSGTGCG